ncbi:HEAT repeat domain-containing protein, partial [Streptomyces sp. NPDC057052]
ATVDHLLDLLGPLDPHDGLRFWAAAAAVQWPGPRVAEFLRACAAGPRPDVAEAAAASLRGEWRACSPA